MRLVMLLHNFQRIFFRVPKCLPFHFNDPSPLKKSIETQYAFIYLSKPVGKHCLSASRMTINVETCRHKKGAKIMLITRVVKHHKANTSLQAHSNFYVYIEQCIKKQLYFILVKKSLWFTMRCFITNQNILCFIYFTFSNSFKPFFVEKRQIFLRGVIKMSKECQKLSNPISTK